MTDQPKDHPPYKLRPSPDAVNRCPRRHETSAPAHSVPPPAPGPVHACRASWYSGPRDHAFFLHGGANLVVLLQQVRGERTPEGVARARLRVASRDRSMRPSIAERQRQTAAEVGRVRPIFRHTCRRPLTRLCPETDMGRRSPRRNGSIGLPSREYHVGIERPEEAADCGRDGKPRNGACCAEGESDGALDFFRFNGRGV